MFPDNKYWDSAYVGMNASRGEINRNGGNHVGIGVGWESGHAKCAGRKNPEQN